MKLLIDEMMDPTVARQLRERGHDVIAVAESDTLRGLSDASILLVASEEGRVIVTENAPDFRVLQAEAMQRGDAYPLLILTSDRRFPRHDERTVGRLVTALDALLTAESDILGPEHWLQ